MNICALPLLTLQACVATPESAFSCDLNVGKIRKSRRESVPVYEEMSPTHVSCVLSVTMPYYKAAAAGDPGTAPTVIRRRTNSIIESIANESQLSSKDGTLISISICNVLSKT